jgi:hypothetical protein
MDGVTVYRQNATGRPGIWRCRAHNEAIIHPDVKDLTDLLEDNPPAPTPEPDA